MKNRDVPNYLSVSADAFFRCGYEEEFTKTMEKANSILPESKIKRELTENDKKLIDLLIDEKYPSLAKNRAKELAEQIFRQHEDDSNRIAVMALSD